VAVFRNDGPNAVIRFDSSIIITTTLANPDFLFPFFENPASVNKAGQFGVRALVPITEQDASGNALGVRTIAVNVFSAATENDVESDRIIVSIAQREVDQPEARVITAAQALLVNGDFELGNTGFSSSYTFSPGNLFPEGTYDVATNPQADNSNFSPCGDHTTGTGNMMIVNGAVQPNMIVWSETVTVLPNRTYNFSGWATSVFPTSPAHLQFLVNINNVPIGELQLSSTTCQWQPFTASWFSGTSTTATLSIVDLNTDAFGNDFALDDLSFVAQ
jgi:hypothetical protein